MTWPQKQLAFQQHQLMLEQAQRMLQPAQLTQHNNTRCAAVASATAATADSPNPCPKPTPESVAAACAQHTLHSHALTQTTPPPPPPHTMPHNETPSTKLRKRGRARRAPRTGNLAAAAVATPHLWTQRLPPSCCALHHIDASNTPVNSKRHSLQLRHLKGRLEQR